MAAGTLLHPGRHPGRGFRFPRQRRAYVTPPVFTPTVPGFGAGGATFLLSLEPGTKVTFGWSTDIFTSYSGKESRTSLFGSPRRRFDGNAFLLDGNDRDVKGLLVRYAAAGSTFLLALPFEELLLTADTLSTVCPVTSTASIDWLLAGQRVAVLGGDGTTLRAVVQSFTSTTVTLGVVDAAGNLTSAQNLGTKGRAGARIVPLVLVLLDPAQGFARYTTAAGIWGLRSAAAVPGWVGQDVMGLGASLLTYDSEDPIPVTLLTDADNLIWDRPNLIDSTANESMLALDDVVDLGALPFGIGGATAPVWTRSLKYRSASRDDWQWLKAFLRRVRGRQVPFLLSTNRPDLAPVSASAGQLLVKSADSLDQPNSPAAWFASPAHRRLAITYADDTVQYVQILAVVDQGNGTTLLTLSDSLGSGLVKVSFLEVVRFDRDELEVSWDGNTFSIDEVVVTVQDLLEDNVKTLGMYGTGDDGAVVLDGVNTFTWATKSGSIYTMTRDLHATDLTITSGSELRPSGFVVHSKGTGTGPGKITANGGDGGTGAGNGISGGTAGTAAYAGPCPLPTPQAGLNGGNHQTAGTDGSASNVCPRQFAGTGGARGVAATAGNPGNNGGNGGPGRGGGGGSTGHTVTSGNNGGSGGTGTISPVQHGDILTERAALEGRNMNGSTYTLGSQSGSGAGSAVSTGGGGGASGGGGGWIALRIFKFAASPSQLVIEAKGGNGGPGGLNGSGVSQGAAGGAGGPGGFVAIRTTDANPPVPNVSGGLGGAGRAGSGQALTGGSGGNGGDGFAAVFN